MEHTSHMSLEKGDMVVKSMATPPFIFGSRLGRNVTLCSILFPCILNGGVCGSVF